jgi:hypothetical protein
VKLINTDGLALIGPGSEWLWSTVAGVVAVVTLLAIYRQLRMQHAAREAAEIEASWREFTSEAMHRRQLAFLVARQDGTDPADMPYTAVGYLGPYFDDLGYRVRAGHLDPKFVHRFFGPTIRSWWVWLTAETEVARRRWDAPWIGRDFEWLAGQMAELDRKAGITRVYDEEHLASQIPARIETLREGIRFAEELRTVIVRPVPAALTPGTTVEGQGRRGKRRATADPAVG